MRDPSGALLAAVGAALGAGVTQATIVHGGDVTAATQAIEQHS